MFKQINTFLMWPLSMPAQVLSRQLKSPEGDRNGIVGSLQLLRSTMEGLKGPSGHWNGLIGDIALQLAELGTVAKKRKRGKKCVGQNKEIREGQ